jgi:predicted nuclease with TOPRIM domain
VSDTEILSIQEQNDVFQSAYKETTGCKSSKLHGLGYLAKHQTQARASAALHEKNMRLEAEVQKFREQLADAAAENERKMEERTRQIQEEEEKKREALKETLKAELRQQMEAMLAEHREEALQQVINFDFVYKLGNLPLYSTSNISSIKFNGFFP